MRSKSMVSFRIALAGFLLGWLLFVIGIYQTSKSSSFESVTYFLLAALAALGVGSLIAKRRATQVLGDDDPHANSVRIHGTIGTITAIALAVWGVIVLFVNLLFSQYPGALERLINSYLPIVLFVALLITLLLLGFVFTTAPTNPPAFPYFPSPTAHEPLDRKANGLGYSVPIIGAAIAAITAGIVYDATGTALTAWIWLIVVAIIAAGLLVGTHFSSNLVRPGGAHYLNIAWTIGLTVVVAAMSLGFGASSVGQQQSYSSLDLSVYDATADELNLDVSGGGLKPQSEISVTLGGEGEILLSESVDQNGWIWHQQTLPAAFPEGTTEITAVGYTQDGSELRATVKVSNDNGVIDFSQDGFGHAELNVTQPITFSWFISYILPAFLMAVTVVIVLYWSEIMRTRVRNLRQTI